MLGVWPGRMLSLCVCVCCVGDEGNYCVKRADGKVEEEVPEHLLRTLIWKKFTFVHIRSGSKANLHLSSLASPVRANAMLPVRVGSLRASKPIFGPAIHRSAERQACGLLVTGLSHRTLFDRLQLTASATAPRLPRSPMSRSRTLIPKHTTTIADWLGKRSRVLRRGRLTLFPGAWCVRAVANYSVLVGALTWLLQATTSPRACGGWSRATLTVLATSPTARKAWR